MRRLEKMLGDIDGKSYGGYKSIKGKYNFQSYDLDIVRVQGDPFASPSLIKVIIDLEKYGYSKDLYKNSSRKTAFEDFFNRRFSMLIRKNVKGNRGSGKSGRIDIYKPGQEILKRSAVEIFGNKMNIKFYAGLPAAGRRVLAKEAKTMFFREIPAIVEDLKIDKTNIKSLENHVKTAENSNFIRNNLNSKGLVAFIANESVLPRRSGVDERPLENAVKFISPETCFVEVELADGSKISGMGIKKGVTVITGGGFHGKSTLLNAIEKGVYNHIPGDGREYVVTDYNAVKIRAEDGRGISNVDISAFINNLPQGKRTDNFYTPNASGSTSQAANIVEAIELGSDLLLIDEDTSATNFMMRDMKIQQVIKREKEPITPFIERIQAMNSEMNISTIVVVGGLGDYFDVADNIIMMDEYKTIDVTKSAKEAISKYDRISESNEFENKGFEVKKRSIKTKLSDKLFEGKDKIKSRDTDEISIGREEIDLRSVEQLVEKGQNQFIGEAIKYMLKNKSGDIELSGGVRSLEKRLENENITEIVKQESGNLVYTRRFEVGSAINRIREQIF